MTRSITICLIAALLFAVPLRAQQSTIVGTALMREALAGAAAEDLRRRDAIVEVLRSADAREVAGRLGLDLTRAETAVASLTSEELALVEARLPVAEADLAGGLQLTRNQWYLLGVVLVVIVVILILAGDGYGDDEGIYEF